MAINSSAKVAGGLPHFIRPVGSRGAGGPDLEVARQLHRAICGPTVFPRGREKEKGPNEGQLLFFLRRRQLANNNGSPSQGQSIQHEACIGAEVSMLPTAAAEWHAAEGCCTLAEST